MFRRSGEANALQTLIEALVKRQESLEQWAQTILLQMKGMGNNPT